MEDTITVKKKFQSNFINHLENEVNHFKNDLTQELLNSVISKIKILRGNNNIGFTSNNFGRISVQDILLELSQEINSSINNEIKNDLVLKNEDKAYTFEDENDIYKTTDFYLSLKKSNDNSFLKTLDNKNIETYISRVRYIIYLSDHFLCKFKHPVCNFKNDLIFITEIFRHCIDIVSLKKQICEICFRQIGSGKEKIEKYNKKYCHIHKDSKLNSNLDNGKKSFNNLSKNNKYIINRFQKVKRENGDNTKIEVDNDINYFRKRVISISYHPTILHFNSIDKRSSSFKITKEILNLPRSLAESRERIKNRVGESGTVFDSEGIVSYITYFTSLSSQNTQLQFNLFIKEFYPLTYAGFKQQTLPIENTVNNYIRALNQKEYLDNEHDPTQSFYWLFESFRISEILLVSEQNILEKKRLETKKATEEKQKKKEKIERRIIQLLDEGETVIVKIKAILDDENLKIRRQKIADIVKEHREAK